MTNQNKTLIHEKEINPHLAQDTLQVRLAIIATFVLLAMENKAIQITVPDGSIEITEGFTQQIEAKLVPAFVNQIGGNVKDLLSLKAHLTEALQQPVGMEVKNYAEAFTVVRSFLGNLDLESYPTGEVCDFQTVISVVP
jgi:hypothetical protein